MICHILTVIDGVSEESIYFTEIQSFELDQFRVQFDVDPVADPEMLDKYAVGPDDIAFLAGYLKTEIAFDFTKNGYLIEAITKDF